jgi:flagellar motor switch/type III secretory pathway protein FliN
MAELTPELAPEIVAACRAGAGKLGEALSRTLDVALQATVGEPSAFDLSAGQPFSAAGPALVTLLTCGDRGLLAILPESSLLVPDWCAKPDAAARGRLATLAQELGPLLLPVSCPADDFRTFHSGDAAGTWAAAELAPDAALVPVELTAGDGRQATLYLLFPCLAPQAVAADEVSQPSAAPAEAADGPATRQFAMPLEYSERGFDELPSYTRSLLKIKVPVTVKLAGKKHPVSQIVSLVPGAILQFDKSCEELLEVEVGGRTVAVGEAVKVGDKFGIRVTSMTLPLEQFVPIHRPRG